MQICQEKYIKEVFSFSESASAFNCYSFEKATSSLDVAYALYNENSLNIWDSVLVAKQTAGRGQVGREWESPTGNLYAALRLPNDGLFSTHALAIIVGGILVEKLNDIFSEKCLSASFPANASFRLKWTNDILIRDCNNYFKSGGILVEEKGNCLLCGIGINLLSAPIFSEKLEKNAINPSYISKYYKLGDLSINALWQRLVHSIYLCYISKTLGVKASNQDEINFLLQRNALKTAQKLLAFKNEEVYISEALILEDFDYGENREQITEYTGILREISLEKSSLGALVIDTSYGKRTFIAGRVRPL